MHPFGVSQDVRVQPTSLHTPTSSRTSLFSRPASSSPPSSSVGVGHDNPNPAAPLWCGRPGGKTSSGSPLLTSSSRVTEGTRTSSSTVRQDLPGVVNRDSSQAVREPSSTLVGTSVDSPSPSRLSLSSTVRRPRETAPDDKNSSSAAHQVLTAPLPSRSGGSAHHPVEGSAPLSRGSSQERPAPIKSNPFVAGTTSPNEQVSNSRMASANIDPAGAAALRPPSGSRRVATSPAPASLSGSSPSEKRTRPPGPPPPVPGARLLPLRPAPAPPFDDKCEYASDDVLLF